ncbi:hypothetical protein TNCV_869821 [Trichonephila clavipes]|nr:hypothetical protein TNCV_869821 [Trichonephila clavipes]
MGGTINLSNRCTYDLKDFQAYETTLLLIPNSSAKLFKHSPSSCFPIPVVNVSDYGKHLMSSSPVPPKTRRVGQRCTLNLSRAETSSRWCGVVVKRGRAY